MYLGRYVQASTANPLGWKPWGVALGDLSGSATRKAWGMGDPGWPATRKAWGMGVYKPANFVIPTHGELGELGPWPATRKAWGMGLGQGMIISTAPPAPAPSLFSSPLLLIGGGVAIWYFFFRNKGSSAPRTPRVPMITLPVSFGGSK
jgi:hypothetical protein